MIQGKIDVDERPVNDIASGIIQIASNILNDQKQRSNIIIAELHILSQN